MDTRIPISEELPRIAHSDYYSDLPKIEFTPICLEKHAAIVLPLFWQGWKEITGDDKSKDVKISIAGKETEVVEIEALLYWYLEQGCEIRLAFVNEKLAGMFIYRPIFEGVIAIRFFYFAKEYRKMYLAQDLIKNIGGITAVVFQTQKSMNPKTLFKRIKDRPVKICEGEKLITWSMIWENS